MNYSAEMPLGSRDIFPATQSPGLVPYYGPFPGPGSYTHTGAPQVAWTPPAGVRDALVECWGAGAGGSASIDTTHGGIGGGGGGYAAKVIQLFPGYIYGVNTYDAPAGGTTADAGNPWAPQDGQDCIFNSGYNPQDVYVCAGFGTPASATQATGGYSPPFYNPPGQYTRDGGSTYVPSTTQGGGGGGAGGFGADGGNSTTGTGGTAGTGGGAGGAGGLTAVGSAGATPGGGGGGGGSGGATRRAGGAGSPSRIKITWPVPDWFPR